MAIECLKIYKQEAGREALLLLEEYKIPPTWSDHAMIVELLKGIRASHPYAWSVVSGSEYKPNLPPIVNASIAAKAGNVIEKVIAKDDLPQTGTDFTGPTPTEIEIRARSMWSTNAKKHGGLTWDGCNEITRVVWLGAAEEALRTERAQTKAENECSGNQSSC